MVKTARKTLLLAIIPRPAGEDVIVARLPDEHIRGRWEAGRIINAIRGRLPLENIARDIVIVGADSVLFGSSPDAETFIRSLGSFLTSCRWKQLDVHV